MTCSKGPDKCSIRWVRASVYIIALVDVETRLGFELWSDPNNREDGYVQWQVDGQPTVRLGAQSVGPDMGPNGTQVGQRLISEEPMVGHLCMERFRILNCFAPAVNYPQSRYLEYVTFYAFDEC